MPNITFVTGNQAKADYLEKYLGVSIGHKKIDLDEIQSLDLMKIVEHKVKQAYKIVKEPVLVEDGSLEFKAFGRLPGTFIRFYMEEMSFETICRTLDGFTREATAQTVYGYYDGKELRFFKAGLTGIIAEHPKGKNGYGWDSIFIPDGYSITRAELDEEQDRITYMQLKPFEKLKTFFENR